MKTTSSSIIFDNRTEIVEVMALLNYFIRQNQRYEEILSTFWEEDVAEEVRPLLEIARELLHEVEAVYINYTDE